MGYKTEYHQPSLSWTTLLTTFQWLPCLSEKAQHPASLCSSFLSDHNFSSVLLIHSIPATLASLLFTEQSKHRSASEPLPKLIPVSGTVVLQMATCQCLCCLQLFTSNAIFSMRLSRTTLCETAACTISQQYLLFLVSLTHRRPLHFSRA